MLIGKILIRDYILVTAVQWIGGTQPDRRHQPSVVACVISGCKAIAHRRAAGPTQPTVAACSVSPPVE